MNTNLFLTIKDQYVDILSTRMVRCWNFKAENAEPRPGTGRVEKRENFNLKYHLTLHTQYQPEFGEGFEHMNHPKPKV